MSTTLHSVRCLCTKFSNYFEKNLENTRRIMFEKKKSIRMKVTTKFSVLISVPDEDLSEFAQQTARFAQKHGKNITPNGTGPDLLSGSSRSSSYSDIVNSSENGKNKEPRRNHTFPGITPENLPGKGISL